MSELVDALDMAEMLYQDRDHKKRILSDVLKYNRRGLSLKFVDEISDDHPVLARVDWGRWSALCECGGQEYVTIDQPFFYCFSCGNNISGGMLRPVKFPSKKMMKDIEKELVKRPLDTSRGVNKITKALRADPLIKVKGEDGKLKILSWSWDPDETIADLKEQNKLIDKVKDQLVGGGN